jgi:hypothetical protein
MQLSIYMADNIGRQVKSRLPYDCKKEILNWMKSNTKWA